MITLIEKIKKQLDTATPKLNRPIYQSKKIEKIADDYAIGFANWCRIQDNNNPHRIIFTDRLLEIYKKEKGL